MKVLILGGTGAMGAYLAELLAERKDDVYVTSRSDRNKDGINFIKGNAKDIEFLRNLLEVRYDAVVDFMKYHTEEFRQRANVLLGNTDQYIFFSSSRVYADSAEPLTESSPRLLDVCNDNDYLETDEYALAKARQEDILFESGNGNWTIIRPYITYSNERLQLGAMEKESWLSRAIKGKSIVFPKDVAEHTTTMTYGLDVAKTIMRLICNKDAYGKAVHIAGTDSMKWGEVLDIYADELKSVTGTRPNVYWLNDSAELMLEMKNEYQVKYDRMYDRVFNNSLAASLSGDLLYTSMEEGLRRCLYEFIKDNHQFKNISWRFEGWADRKCDERTSLSNIDGLKNKLKYELALKGMSN